MLTNLNFHVIEVAYVHQIMYGNDPEHPEDDGMYHLVLSLLLDINGQEVVCELSGAPDQLKDVIDLDQEIQIMVQEGNVTRCTGTTTFGALLNG